MKILDSVIHANKWVKFFIGSLTCIVIFILFVDFNLEKSFIVKQFIIPLAVPGAFALMGLLEIITGIPFKEMSGKWDNLKGWQRGILGIAVAILTFIILGYAIVLFA